jgi:hypothetical protein
MTVLALEGGLTMQDRFFATITEGMTVEDADGDKVGTVGAIYQPAQVVSTATTAASAATEPVMKINRGLLGLGKHLYIPATAIRDVTTDRIILVSDKTRIDDMGWDQKPAWIDD